MQTVFNKTWQLTH